MRNLRYFILIIVLLAMSSPGAAVRAEPPCEPIQPCARIFSISPLLALDPNRPFAWLRSAPNSSAPVVYTVKAKGKFYLHPEKVFVSIQNEWWIGVSLVPNAKIRGWVERESLITEPSIAHPGNSVYPFDNNQAVANSRVLSAKWIAPPRAASARLIAKVRYAWIRTLPQTSEIIAEITPADTFVILNMVSPYFDGVQWWWPIQFDSRQGLKNGWIEQTSVVVVYRSNPSPTAMTCKLEIGCQSN